MVLTFESVDKILKCDQSNESHWAVLSCYTVYYAVEDGSDFWVCDWWIKSKVLQFKTVSVKATGQYFPMFLGYYAVQSGSYFWVCGWPPEVLPQHFLWKIVTCNYQLTVIELVKFIHHNIKESRIWRDKMYIELAGAHHMGHKHLKAHWAIHGWELCDERLFRTRRRLELWEHCDV